MPPRVQTTATPADLDMTHYPSFGIGALTGILLTTMVCLGDDAHLFPAQSFWPWLMLSVGLALFVLFGLGLQAFRLGCEMRRNAVADCRQVNEALALEKRFSDALIDSLPGLFYVIDENGLIVRRNANHEKLTGYDSRETADWNVLSFFQEEDRERVATKMAEAFAGRDCNVEVKLVLKSGERVPYLLTGSCRTIGGTKYLIGLGIDLHRLKMLEEALRASERHLRLIAENATDMIWVVDFTGRFTYFSPSIRRFLGYTPEEATRLRILDVMTPESGALAIQNLTEAYQGIMAGQHFEPRTLELEHVRKDGSRVWTEVVCSEMRDEEGRVIAVQGVTRDMTERRRMEQELRDAKEGAEAATRAKSRFLAVMSHEIRTPMTAILGYADLLTDPRLGPETRQEYLATIRRSGEHLLLLIDDILDLSKIEAGKLVLDMNECRVAQTLAEVASMMRPRAKQRGNTLEIEYATEIPETIFSAPSSLRQALVNLTGNAVKFTKNGSVRLRVSCVPNWRNDQAGVRIEVIDTGIGIRPEAVPRLFQPFSQADFKVSTNYGGTGLGLAISRQIVEMLGGELSVTSEFGRGSVFALTVPAGDLTNAKMLRCPAETLADTGTKHELTIETSLRGIRILLAEDGADNQRLISTVLRRVGADVKIAENGLVAVAMAEAERFDVLLMDMNMPEMNGDEATRRLRSRNYRGPILAITAATMTEDVARSLQAGCDDHLSKPINLPKLIQTVQSFARRGSIADFAEELSDPAEKPIQDAPNASRLECHIQGG